MSILHFGEHHRDALRSEVREFSEQVGSKGGILEYLRKFPDLQNHILPGFPITYEQLGSGSIPDLPSDFRLQEKSLIYRSSHPDDHRGYIGMLPTECSRHYKEERYRSVYDLSNHELNLAKVYNALSYYQMTGKEQSCSYGGRIEDYYNIGAYPVSDPRQYYNSHEDIPYQEYRPFFNIDPYGYHIDYLSLYTHLLEKMKRGEDCINYGEALQSITEYIGGNYRGMIELVHASIQRCMQYQEHTGLRDSEKTGIYIQPEILPNGSVQGGIFESPHKQGVYIITFRNPTPKSDEQRRKYLDLHAYDDFPATITYDSNTGKIVDIEGGSYGRIHFIGSVIELYKKVGKKKIFGENYSFHMEFGFQGDLPLIYQIRQFSPYQESSFMINPNARSFSGVVRGITDEKGERVNLILLGGYSGSADVQPSDNIGIHFLKQELSGNIPLRQRRLVTGTGYGRLDDDHGLTKLLYETGGIAVGGTLPGPIPNRDYTRTQAYTGTLFSDGVNIKIEGLEEIS